MAMQGTFGESDSENTRDSQLADIDLFGDDAFTPFEGGASTHTAYPSSAYSSPANAPYDINALSSSGSTNLGTVSPQDLHLATFSAPNSTAFTNLTSPSMYGDGSPDYTDNFDVSPFIVGSDLDAQLAGDPWYPLFPQEDQQQQSAEDQSPLLPEEELEVSEHLRANRRRSGTASSPPTASHASVSGVSSRKRDKPLPPILVDDPTDTVAMKRARNTLAARKSRQRKMQRFEELEDEIAKLKTEVEHWKGIALQRKATGGI